MLERELCEHLKASLLGQMAATPFSERGVFIPQDEGVPPTAKLPIRIDQLYVIGFFRGMDIKDYGGQDPTPYQQYETDCFETEARRIETSGEKTVIFGPGLTNEIFARYNQILVEKGDLKAGTAMRRPDMIRFDLSTPGRMVLVGFDECKTGEEYMMEARQKLDKDDGFGLTLAYMARDGLFGATVESVLGEIDFPHIVVNSAIKTDIRFLSPTSQESRQTFKREGVVFRSVTHEVVNPHPKLLLDLQERRQLARLAA